MYIIVIGLLQHVREGFNVSCYGLSRRLERFCKIFEYLVCSRVDPMFHWFVLFWLLSFIISSTLSFISDWFHLLIFMQIWFLKWTYRRAKLFISEWLFIRSSFDVTMINARACLWFKRRIIINIKVRLCL